MYRLLAIISTGAFSPMLKRGLNLARIHVILAGNRKQLTKDSVHGVGENSLTVENGINNTEFIRIS